MKKTILYYETKCRKCERIHEWFVAEKKDLSYKAYLMLIFSKVESPSGYDCICTKDGATLQDIVTYQYKD